MKITLNMGGLDIGFSKEEIDGTGGEIELITREDELVLHLSHNALRKVESAINNTRKIQHSALKDGQGELIADFSANL